MHITKAVLFDLDGTLLNTLDDLTAGVNYALTRHGFPPRTSREVRSYLGNGPARLLGCACPDGTPPETVAAVLETYLPYYAAHSADATCPYPGVTALLERLSAAGVAVGVVSNKQEVDTVALCRRFFGDRVTVALGDVPDRPRKPAPDGVLQALERLGVSPENAWYVGDSEVDVATARAAGLRCVAVTWGFRDAPELLAAGADVLADTPEQIAEYILNERGEAQ